MLLCIIVGYLCIGIIDNFRIVFGRELIFNYFFIGV